MRDGVRPVTPAAMGLMTTARLRAYKKRLLSLQESPELSDCSPEELAGLDPELLFFKSDERWAALVAEIARRS